MNFLKTRVLPLLLSLVMAVSFMVVPSFAVFGTEDFELPTIDPVAFFDKDLLESEMNRLFGDNSNDHCAFFSEFAYIANKSNWVETSKANLVVLATQWNQSHGLTYSSTASVDSHTLDDGTEISFIRVKISDSRLGGSRTNWTWCLNDGAGKILVALPETDSDKVIPDGSHWIAKDSAEKNLRYSHPMTGAKMKQLCTALELTGEQVYIANFGTKYKAIYKDGREVFAGSDGYPFVSAADDAEWAVNQSRPQTDSKEQTEDIIEGVIDGLESGIDLGSMTLTLPNGFVAFIDDIIYDESTKSYHIDSHDTYNTTINNYYTWNYYINYTSITYIGQTEEYNKYYEVYYELPDGRSSADLTKEDLEQLNLSVDVIPYGRSADDTSLRSLYHFDGDTKDSSYWNYCTDFTWNKGASLTYMDAGVFDGALYLDETEHDFTLTLPSNLLSSDFTLQFRYYQSATVAPVTDSYIRSSAYNLLSFNGSQLLTGGGTAVSAMPVGSWNEIALIRSGGNLYIYLNGVRVALDSSFAGITLGRNFDFHFGSSQQTFKYFDELRVLNYALVEGGINYEPTAVPHDTNLTLVLPDSVIPVADEYWSFVNDSQVNLLESYGLDDFTDFSGNAYLNAWTQLTSKKTNGYERTPFEVDYRYTDFPRFSYYTNLTNFSLTDAGLNMRFNSANGLITKSDYASLGWSRYVGAPTSGLFSVIGSVENVDYVASPSYIVRPESRSGVLTSAIPQDTYYTMSLVNADGDVESVTFYLGCNINYEAGHMSVNYDRCTEAFGYRFGLALGGGNKTYDHLLYFLVVQPISDSPDDIVYMELVEGDSTNLTAEFIESVTLLDKEDLNTPTLAVRTDIDITSYQIGGVRPSLPKKGMVWAMVENERITSLQVYYGQAWEGVDGRIWTGERWVPYSSYNIITLQDLYDIVDATPNYEYIYSEAGFWAWWQKSWNAFTEKLFLTLGAGGAAGGTSINPDKLPSVPDDESTAEDDGWSFVELLVVLKDGTWNVITGVVSTAYDGFYGFVQAVSDSGSFFDYYDPDNEQSIFFIPLEEGASVWD